MGILRVEFSDKSDNMSCVLDSVLFVVVRKSYSLNSVSCSTQSCQENSRFPIYVDD